MRRKKKRGRVALTASATPHQSCVLSSELAPSTYRSSIRFGCASGFFDTVTCSTPLVSSAPIDSGSIDSGSVTVRVTLP